jgi:hypothetical protein
MIPRFNAEHSMTESFLPSLLTVYVLTTADTYLPVSTYNSSEISLISLDGIML